MKFFCDPSIVDFISDASIDFTPTDFDAPLTAAQQAYLRKETGVDIPQVFWRKQVHGDDVLVATKSSGSGCPDADAYITNTPRLPIAIRTADCVPVFLYDPMNKVIGLAHAGWKGTHKQIAYKTAMAMQEKFHCRPQDIQAALGPSIRAYSYEVGEEFREYFPEDIIELRGKLFVDVSGNNRRQLLKAGILATKIFDCGVCTYANPNYFSFRRDAEKAGRMISVMMLK